MYKLQKSKMNKILFMKKIKRVELANMAGISIETLNSWMYRDTKATKDTALKVSSCLEIDILEIFIEA